MPGSDNNVQYSQGYRLEASSAQDIMLMQKTATDVSIINGTGSPEGAVSANPSSEFHDRVSGNVWTKQTGTGNTGWVMGGSGSGDVVGPASSTDLDLAVFDGVTGKLIQDTGISSTSPTFTGNTTSLTRIIAPYDTGTGTGFYFSDGTVAATQVGTAQANYFFGNSGNSTVSGIANTLVGQDAGNSMAAAVQNTGMGNGALFSVQNGSGNCALGYLAGQGIVNSSNCNAVGVGSLSGASGDNNNAFGTLALQNCLGTLNAAFGQNSLQSINSANFNSAFGNSCASALLTGSNNLFLGYASGNTYTGAESGNILIDSFGVNGESNVTRIGTNQTTFFAAGINGVTVTGSAVLCATNGQLGTVVSSERFKEDIKNVEDYSIMSLRPVRFKYKNSNDYAFGLIAEEVEKLNPELCIYDDEGLIHSVKYHELPALLLKEIQRLNERINKLEQKLNGD